VFRAEHILERHRSGSVGTRKDLDSAVRPIAI
jgi:hypothetical protein